MEKGQLKEIKISDIKPNPYQPRLTFKESSLRELAQSIERNGLLQPISVRKTVTGYTLIAGERRFRAMQSLKREYIPAVILNLTDEEMMTHSILENLQREDLDTFEEAISYKKYMEALNLNQEQVAKNLGKSRSYIANTIRLLNLPNRVVKMIKDNELTSAHGRTLLSLKDPITIEQVAERSRDEKWNVRKLERYVQRFKTERGLKKTQNDLKKPRIVEQTEQKLKETLGTKVEIKRVNNRGYIEIDFTNQKEFERIVNYILNGGE
ncbi:ParB/RepB/Spo0J family partition protein [Phocicoccus pinnipedialis]|uniref:Nucleoid occlusion protein n=1 Tax=Phocicoccus pinnipedialis TaxID=110845 RepID=A0A6V7R4T3_9BACL|nr:ParB/RepB/Spo0J family partition protein [Jeotgalicoccus pinnipedialis]MBP1939714.1 ParB family chromosome partitioning protein [Jeotgalicoccus pinnipedialis]CAD2072336.1 Nucleoid occlusion protein [Jeotgalicoccus pinnipedialis]